MKEPLPLKRPGMKLVEDTAEIIEDVPNGLSISLVISEKEINEISTLANEIWHEHYEAIIGKEQVNYMIDKFQSPEVIKKQIEEENYKYYRLDSAGDLSGYFSWRLDNNSLFLSKLYIRKKCRGKNYARKILEFLEARCREEKLNKIWLTVNKDNTNSIAIYENLGFVKMKTQIADIGSGYVMDDYIMEKNIK